MSHRPAGLGDRWNRRLGWTNTRHLSDRVDPAALEQEVTSGAAAAAVAEAQCREKVEHPVIEHPVYTTPYRVTRRFKTRDGVQTELIGETKTENEARRIANREKWAAFVTDSNGRMVYFNWHDMENRA